MESMKILRNRTEEDGCEFHFSKIFVVSDTKVSQEIQGISTKKIKKFLYQIWAQKINNLGHISLFHADNT